MPILMFKETSYKEMMILQSIKQVQIKGETSFLGQGAERSAVLP